MIRKLRRKFVLINMLFVSAVLLAVFAVLCLSTYRQIRTDTDEALSRALTMDAAGNKNPPILSWGIGSRTSTRRSCRFSVSGWMRTARPPTSMGKR